MTNSDLIFVSEPNIFYHDAKQLMAYLHNNYSFSLNSEDTLDPEAPYTKNRTSGGSMVLWKSELDKYISVHPVSSTSFLPVVFSPPGVPTTVHIGLYLPTSGLETQFIDQITELRMIIEELVESYPGSFFYLRGDSNVNPNNKANAKIFVNFFSDLGLLNIPTMHKIYHYFIGDGLFGSSIDVILHSESAPFAEKIEKIFCQDIFPEIDSHPDIILSCFELPQGVFKNIFILEVAPKIDHERYKIDC